jgi:hypothetical protein
MKRLGIGIGGLLALLSASPAIAATTLGQLTPVGATSQNCGPSSGAYVQATVSSGPSYALPANGLRITSWSTSALATSGQQVSLMVFRRLSGDSFMTVTHDGPHTLIPSVVNTFQINLAVQPGDVLGLNPDTSTSFPTGCGFLAAGETGEFGSFPNPPPADGASGTFFRNTDRRLNATAEVEVSNAFSFGATSRNKKKGNATTMVHAAGPGTFTLGGSGLKAQQATLGNLVGDASLQVVPKGKVKKKLRQQGKTRVTISVTYTPSGGTANTQSAKVKLVKR